VSMQNAMSYSYRSLNKNSYAKELSSILENHQNFNNSLIKISDPDFKDNYSEVLGNILQDNYDLKHAK
jgi:Na+-transporting NADH:ubiquinone oxidoreductase subunit NqrF